MATVEERLSRLEGVYEHLATRADIEALRGDNEKSIEALRGDIEKSMEALRGDIARAEARMLRWTMGTIIAAAAVFIGIDRFAG
jgi:hypothetical protein